MHKDFRRVHTTGKIQTLTGEKESPARGKVYSGDLIQKIDDQTVKDIGDVQECLNSLTADPVIIILKRDGQSVSVELKPIQDIHKEYRLGIWLRDREQGVGTLTYVNPETQEYGAVGHGITDVDTREIMSVGNGSITTATIVRVIPGSHGTPDEIQESIGSSRLGNIEINLENGIYGEVYAESILSREAYPIALKNEVKEGEASILCSLDGSGPKEYDIHIRKNESMIDSEDTLIVEITDAKLLEQTGGIIQGMSGLTDYSGWEAGGCGDPCAGE